MKHVCRKCQETGKWWVWLEGDVGGVKAGEGVNGYEDHEGASGCENGVEEEVGEEGGEG